MRTSPILLAATLIAAPAAAKDPVRIERNQLAAMMAQLGGGGVLMGKKLEEAVEKAERNPLGSRDNPIRSDGPPGERAYLSRLRCSDGAAPTVGVRGSVGPGPYGTILDLYPVRCGEAPPTDVYMDMYFRHVEDRPVPGFTVGTPGTGPAPPPVIVPTQPTEPAPPSV